VKKKRRRKKPDIKDRIRAVLIAASAIGAAGVISLLMFCRAPAPKLEPPSIPAPAPVPERPASKGILAIVIDDAGNNLRDLEPFLELDMPLTIAVLPGLSNSVEAARRVRMAGKELFLHQPMEAQGGRNPGPSAIMAGMGKDEIRAIIGRNLDEIGPVTGINNHEGSRVTMDAEAMDTILALCRERGLVFLDSRTTADTAAPASAGRLGMLIGERDVFIDNNPDREAMKNSIEGGLIKAGQNGTAIMIGHTGSSALAPLLAELSVELRERGYSFSTVSLLLKNKSL